MLTRIFAGLLLLFIATVVTAQTETDSTTKAQALMEAAIKAMGGAAYLNVKSERSRGYITPYREVGDGGTTEPEKLSVQSFTDYILLPDRERVEFKGQDRRFIQSNSPNHNWTFDSDAQILKDQTAAQKQRFTEGMRFQLDQILRGGWRKPDAKLEYVAKQELWPGQKGEGVKITFADGAEVNLFFDAQTSLPIALRFPRETANKEQVIGENRFFKYIELNGIKTPHIVDLYEGKKQTLRIIYEEREFNAAISEKIFIKPDNIKSLK